MAIPVPSVANAVSASHAILDTTLLRIPIDSPVNRPISRTRAERSGFDGRNDFRNSNDRAENPTGYFHERRHIVKRPPWRPTRWGSSLQQREAGYIPHGSPKGGAPAQQFCARPPQLHVSSCSFRLVPYSALLTSSPSQQGISRLCDRQLRNVIARVVLARYQAEVGANFARSRESGSIA